MRWKTAFLVIFVGVIAVFLAACAGAEDGATDGSDDSGGAAIPAPPAAEADEGEAFRPGSNDALSQPDGSSGGSDASTSLIDRKIERQATLEITAENVAGTVAKIEAAATAVGGFVSQSTITQVVARSDDEEPRQEATVQIRVPAGDYSAVMNQLRGFAKEVTSENSTTQEVTAEYTDLQSQLRNLQATEAQYLKLMEQATTIDEILTLQDRLNGVQGQIEQVQGRINLLDNLTALATITVNITLPPLVPAQEQAKSQNWAEETWSRSWEASKDLARGLGIAAIVLGVAGMWLAVPGAIGFAGWRLWERSKKRAAPTV
jgi:hypothetical protein